MWPVSTEALLLLCRESCSSVCLVLCKHVYTVCVFWSRFFCLWVWTEPHVISPSLLSLCHFIQDTVALLLPFHCCCERFNALNRRDTEKPCHFPAVDVLYIQAPLCLRLWSYLCAYLEQACVLVAIGFGSAAHISCDVFIFLNFSILFPGLAKHGWHVDHMSETIPQFPSSSSSNSRCGFNCRAADLAVMDPHYKLPMCVPSLSS